MEALDCHKCQLDQSRTHVVFGIGNQKADLMFVGEAPGAEEDRTGKPFVGRAGQLLTKIIQSTGLTRDDVYIANVLKCRPPGNRNPQSNEIEQCCIFNTSLLSCNTSRKFPKSRKFPDRIKLSDCRSRLI